MCQIKVTNALPKTWVWNERKWWFNLNHVAVYPERKIQTCNVTSTNKLVCRETSYSQSRVFLPIRLPHPSPIILRGVVEIHINLTSSVTECIKWEVKTHSHKYGITIEHPWCCIANENKIVCVDLMTYNSAGVSGDGKIGNGRYLTSRRGHNVPSTHHRILHQLLILYCILFN